MPSFVALGCLEVGEKYLWVCGVFNPITIVFFPYKDTTLRIIGVDHPRGDYRRIIRANKDYLRIIRANKDYSRIIGVSKIILGLLEDY